MQLSIIWHIRGYNVKLYARLSSRLCACASLPVRLHAYAEVFVRHHFTTKRKIFHISRKSTVYGWLLEAKHVFGGGFSGI